jgi:hypothetical protein
MVATIDEARTVPEPVPVKPAVWRRTLDGVRRIPLTIAYCAALIIVGILFAENSAGFQNTVIDATSTNLHNLLHGHLATLFTSAFVTADPVWTTLPVLGCALALVELRFGSRRMLGTFLAGHVGATLIVAVGLIVAVAAGWMSHDVMLAEDVGVSYGGMALIGALVVVLPHRWRRGWAAGWIVLAAAGIALGRTFTNVGHFVSVLIGLSVGLYMLRSRATMRGTAQEGLSRLDRGLLAVTCALGLAFLLG